MAPWDYRHGGKQKKSDKELRSTVEPAVPQVNEVTCGNKRYCKEMTSCDEARFYLTQCELYRLDGDGDGVPLRNCVNDRIFSLSFFHRPDPSWNYFKTINLILGKEII